MHANTLWNHVISMSNRKLDNLMSITDKLHEWYYSNATDYFTAMFLLCCESDYMANNHLKMFNLFNPEVHSFYASHMYETNIQRMHMLEKKASVYFMYGMNRFFPSIAKETFKRLTMLERIIFFVFKDYELFVFTMLDDKNVKEELETNSCIYAKDLQELCKFLNEKTLPKLQDHRSSIMKDFIRNIFTHKTTFKLFPMKDVRHIDCYGIDMQSSSSNRILDYVDKGIAITPEYLNKVIINSKYKTIYDVLMRIFIIMPKLERMKDGYTDLSFMPVNLLLPSDDFVSSICNPLFFVVTYKDGEQRIYLNYESSTNEIRKDSMVYGVLDIHPMLCNCLLRSIELNQSNIDIYFSGNVENFITEFKFYYSAMFEEINYLTRLFRYDHFTKNVSFKGGLLL